MRRLILIVLSMTLAMSAFAQVPPGKWWKRAEIIQRLELTDDQQSRLEGIFRNSASDLIDVKADMDKLAIALRSELDQPQLNRAAIKSIVMKLNEARSRKFEREVMLFVDMRSVLNDAQWNRMRADLDRMQEMGAGGGGQQREQRRNMMRPRP